MRHIIGFSPLSSSRLFRPSRTCESFLWFGTLVRKVVTIDDFALETTFSLHFTLNPLLKKRLNHGNQTHIQFLNASDTSTGYRYRYEAPVRVCHSIDKHQATKTRVVEPRPFWSVTACAFKIPPGPALTFGSVFVNRH